jgi:Tfp pilus assembly protein PilF
MSDRPSPPDGSRRRRRLIWVLIGLGALVAIAVVVTLVWQRSLNGEILAARRAIAAGQFDAASSAADRVKRLSFRPAEALILKARVAIGRGRPAEAFELLRDAKRYATHDSEVKRLGAILAAKAGQYEQAKPILVQGFEEASEPDPQLDEALAKLYLEQFDMIRAAAVIERWKVDAPSDPKPHLWKAEIDSRIADNMNALIGDFSEALKRDPDLPQARLGLADELRKAHRNTEAAAEYSAYLKMKPDDPAAHLGAGQVILELGDEKAADLHFDRAIALDPGNAQVYNERAMVKLRLGDVNAALTLLERAVSIDPYDVPIRYNRGLVFTRLGQLDKAREEQRVAKSLTADLERLSSLRSRLIDVPGDLDLHVEMARWMFAHGQESQGVRWCEKVLKEQPVHSKANALLATYYESQGNVGLANYHRLNANMNKSAP